MWAVLWAYDLPNNAHYPVSPHNALIKEMNHLLECACQWTGYQSCALWVQLKQGKKVWNFYFILDSDCLHKHLIEKLCVNWYQYKVVCLGPRFIVSFERLDRIVKEAMEILKHKSYDSRFTLHHRLYFRNIVYEYELHLPVVDLAASAQSSIYLQWFPVCARLSQVLVG